MKIRNVEKFGTNQLFLNIYLVYFTCCRHLMNLSVKASMWYTLVVNSQKNTCMFRLLLFVVANYHRCMYLSDRPLLVQFIHPWSTAQAMSSTQLLYRHLSHPPHHYHLNHPPSFNHQPPTHKHPASTHTHTHTHTAQVITDLSSPVPRLCRWCSLVRAYPARSLSPSYLDNGWGFLRWRSTPSNN